MRSPSLKKKFKSWAMVRKVSKFWMKQPPRPCAARQNSVASLRKWKNCKLCDTVSSNATSISTSTRKTTATISLDQLKRVSMRFRTFFASITCISWTPTLRFASSLSKWTGMRVLKLSSRLSKLAASKVTCLIFAALRKTRLLPSRPHDREMFSGSASLIMSRRLSHLHLWQRTLTSKRSLQSAHSN